MTEVSGAAAGSAQERCEVSGRAFAAHREAIQDWNAAVGQQRRSVQSGHPRAALYAWAWRGRNKTAALVPPVDTGGQKATRRLMVIAMAVIVVILRLFVV